MATATRDELSRVRTRMGAVLGDVALISNLKVIENVALPLMYHTNVGSAEALERSVELLDTMGYDMDKWSLPGLLPPYALKLVTIARALIMDPAVLLYESVSAIFTESERANIARLLCNYQGASEERLLVFVSSREQDSTLIKADRVVRIVDGRFEG
jgi:phospholipid/cholesterol/gamma-HCH transport system ATP-binding protein